MRSGWNPIPRFLTFESNTMVEMVQKDFLPSVFAYIDKVAATAVAKKISCFRCQHSF